jgi:hypothetical protein
MRFHDPRIIEPLIAKDWLMTKGFVIGAGLVVVIGAATFPFASEAYTRYEVMKKLNPILTEQDRIAFQAWSGDALSFAKSLYARCQLKNGGDAASCNAYRVALE